MSKDSKPGDEKPGERRRRVRVPSEAAVLITILSPTVLAPSVVEVGGRILNDSQDGMKLAVSKPLDPGTVLQIRTENRFILAEVRYCLPDEAGFHVGVEIKDVFDIPTDKGKHGD